VAEITESFWQGNTLGMGTRHHSADTEKWQCRRS
jgi:hypothetical protein